MAKQRTLHGDVFDFCCIKTWTDCSHVGTPRNLRVIALRRGDALPQVGDILRSIPCNILAPDQSCDYCGYQEKHYVTHVVRLNEKAITSMGLHQRMEEALQDGLELPCWDWNYGADRRRFIPDFNEVNRELIDYFASHPDELQRLHWRRFEGLVAAIFRNHGYETILGTGSHDQGVDLRIIQKDPIGEVVTLVQIKKYAGQNPIGLEAVQALSGAIDAERANRGLLVTSSRFLPGAKAFADKLGSRLVLCSPADVARWCKQLKRADGRL